MSVCLSVCVCVCVCVWVRGRETSDIFHGCLPPWTRDNFPNIKDSFTSMTLVILQLNSVTYVSTHLFISNISHVQSISHPPLAHSILTRPTHTPHPHYQTLHSTLCYPTTLPPSPTTDSQTLSSLNLRANRTHTLPSPSYLTHLISTSYFSTCSNE